MSTRLLSPFTVLAFFLLCVTSYANPPIMTMLPDEAEPGQHRLIWSTDPGIRYELQESSNIDDPESWSTVAGYPSEAEALAQQAIIEMDAADRKFYRVRMLDEQPPEILSKSPTDGAFGVGRFSVIGVSLEDASSIDTESLSFTVGDHGTYSTNDTELTFSDNTLVFYLGGDTALGGWGHTMTVSLAVADIAGNSTSYTWNFELEVEPQVVDNLFVFGSPEAQRGGQQIGTIPTRILAERMAGGPIGMNAGADPWTLHSVESDRIVISYTGATAPAFNVDDSLANLTPVNIDDVFYRRVLSVNDDGAQKLLTLTTVEVGLEDLVQEGSFNSSSWDGLYFEIGEDGLIHLPQSYGHGATLPALGCSLDGSNFNLDGLLNIHMEELHWWLTPSFRTSLDIGLTVLRRFDAVVRGDLAAAMVFDVDAILLGSKPEYSIFTLPPPRPGYWIPLGAIGPVPLNATIEFNLEILAEAEAQALISFRTGLRQTAFAEFGIDYVHTRFPSVQWIRDADFSAERVPLSADINGELSLGLKIKPSVSFLVHGLAGMEAALVSSGDTVFSEGVGNELSGNLEADVRLEIATAGVALEWLDPQPTLARSLWSRNWHVYPPLAGLTFVQHPQDVDIDEGERLTLSAWAQSSSPIAYDWYKDGLFYSHGDHRLSIARAMQSHAGDYHAVARSGGQSAVSDTATVTVTAPPSPAPSGMVPIPGGTNSGTNPLSDGEPYTDLYLASYSLAVNSFYMDKYQVTKALWDEVRTWGLNHGYADLREGGGKAANHPVHTVSWYDAVKWCNARSQKEGRPAVYTVDGAVYKTGEHDNVVQTSAAGYRLPTDAEWEYAARGGLSGRRFPWGDTINHEHANYRSNPNLQYHSYDTNPYTTWTYHQAYNTGGMPFTSPVGSFAANGYGLYDMAGNVYEQCFDWHPAYNVGLYRVSRGGSWSTSATGCRVGHRDSGCPTNVRNYVGFRAVLSPGPASAP